MNRKSTASYTAILEFLRDEIPELQRATTFIVDYEAAVRQAIGVTLPEADIRGCWFHFCRALYKKLRCLQRNVRNVDKVAAVVKMSMALALLPQNRINEGILYIRNYINELVVPEAATLNQFG